MTIEAESSTVEGVRIRVDAAGGDAALLGLLFRGGQRHRVEHCEFIQAQVPLAEGRRVASVAIEGVRGTRAGPILDLSECCFLGFRNLESKPAAGPAALTPWC